VKRCKHANVSNLAIRSLPTPIIPEFRRLLLTSGRDHAGRCPRRRTTMKPMCRDCQTFLDVMTKKAYDRQYRPILKREECSPVFCFLFPLSLHVTRSLPSPCPFSFSPPHASSPSRSVFHAHRSVCAGSSEPRCPVGPSATPADAQAHISRSGGTQLQFLALKPLEYFIFSTLEPFKCLRPRSDLLKPLSS
jgi:hypothetical protein